LYKTVAQLQRTCPFFLLLIHCNDWEVLLITYCSYSTTVSTNVSQNIVLKMYILSPDGLFLSLTNNQVYSSSFPVPRAVTINTTRSPLCLAYVSQPPKINLTTLNHAPTLTALCSPVVCTSTLLPFWHDSSARSFFSPVSLCSTSIPKAGRHEPCGKPCCQKQQRYVTILMPFLILKRLNIWLLYPVSEF